MNIFLMSIVHMMQKMAPTLCLKENDAIMEGPPRSQARGGRYHIYFLLKEEPSVNLALPPVGVHKTVEQLSQVTAVWACEKTVVMFKQP